jgi:hypothetical protein
MMNRAMLTLAALAVGLMVTGSAWGVHTFQKMEDFSVDPGWEGVGNRPADGVNSQDYGFSNTNNAGGAAAGEAGGTIRRTGGQPPDPPIAYYADDLNGFVDFDHAFSASGTAQLQNQAAGFLGFFNSTDPCFTSLCGNGSFGGQSVLAGWFLDFASVFMVYEGPGGGVWQSSASNSTTTGTDAFNWSIDYDPNAGNGELSGTFGGFSIASVDIGAGIRASGATFDRFGIASATDTDFGNSGPFFIDDVEYTATPEPAVLGILACGTLLMLRRRRA